MKYYVPVVALLILSIIAVAFWCLYEMMINLIPWKVTKSAHRESIYDYALAKDKSILDKPLSDFFVNTSHNSFLARRQLLSKPSVKNIIRTMDAGARFIELDIHSKNDKPVVRHSAETVNVQNIALDLALKTIIENGFKGTTDPLFVSLEIFDSDNENMMKELAESIRATFGTRLYEYTMKDVMTTGDSTKYFLNAPIKDLIDKVVIITNYFGMDNPTNRDLHLFPVVHGTADEPPQGWIVSSPFQMKCAPETDPRELQTKFVARVYPDNLYKSKNFNPVPFWLLNYNFVALNFATTDDNYKMNERMFRHTNFVPKQMILSSDGAVIKSTGTIAEMPIYESATDNLSVIRPGIAYRSNYNWESDNGKYILVIRDDGNVITYDKKRKIRWTSETHNHKGAYLVMQNDGNLVLYHTKDGQPIQLWQSSTFVAGSHAIIGNNGYINIIGQDGSVVSVIERAPW